MRLEGNRVPMVPLTPESAWVIYLVADSDRKYRGKPRKAFFIMLEYFARKRPVEWPNTSYDFERMFDKSVGEVVGRALTFEKYLDKRRRKSRSGSN